MNLFAVGVNHKTAPVTLRERLAIGPDEQRESLSALRQRASLEEVVLLSTCNRVEIYGAGVDTCAERIVGALAEIRGLPLQTLREHCFVNWGDQAARHIFRVTASLESLVVGEPQILGQVKDAYRFAQDHGTLGAVLGRCLTMAFRGAKRVRSETLVARGGASISSVAVDLARRIFGDLADARVLVVGAGEMARHAALHLRSSASGEIRVVNRSEDRGRSLAQAIGGQFYAWDALEAQLSQCDIVVASTGAPHAVIGADMMKRVMKARKWAPLFLIDIAVPRDIETSVGEMDEVFVYDVDDLRQLVDENLETRAAQAQLADQLLDEEVGAFLAWTRERSAGPVIHALRERTRAVVDAEVARVLSRVPDLSQEQRKLLENLSHGIVNKLLHVPQTQIRADASRGDMRPRSLAQATTELFGIDSTASISPVSKRK